MKIYFQLWLGVMTLMPVLSPNILAADDSADVPLRMANGAVITGVLKEANLDGLVFQGEKGPYAVPWKYLSAGTRYRYEAQTVAANKGAPEPKPTGGKAGKAVPAKRSTK